MKALGVRIRSIHEARKSVIFFTDLGVSLMGQPGGSKSVNFTDLLDEIVEGKDTGNYEAQKSVIFSRTCFFACSVLKNCSNSIPRHLNVQIPLGPRPRQPFGDGSNTPKCAVGRSG